MSSSQQREVVVEHQPPVEARNVPSLVKPSEFSTAQKQPGDEIVETSIDPVSIYLQSLTEFKRTKLEDADQFTASGLLDDQGAHAPPPAQQRIPPCFEISEFLIELKDRQKSLATMFDAKQSVSHGLSPSEGSGGEVETPLLTIARLQKEADECRSVLKTVVENCSESAIKLATQESSLTPEEKDELRVKAQRELREAFGADPETIMGQLDILGASIDGIAKDEKTQQLLSFLKSGGSPLKADMAALSLSGAQKILKEKIAAAEVAGDEEIGKIDIFVPKNKIVPKSDARGEFLELTDRLTKLEEALGIDKMPMMSFPFSNISSALEQIVDKILLWDAKKLDALSRRASEINKDLIQLQGSRVKLMATQQRGLGGGVSSSVAEMDSKIEVLYQNLEKWKSVVHLLPKIVERMRDMHTTITDAKEVETRLSSLEDQMSSTFILLETSKDSLKALKAAVESQEATSQILLEKLISKVNNLPKAK